MTTFNASNISLGPPNTTLTTSNGQGMTEWTSSITGMATIEADDAIISGVSMKEQIEAINKRLAILVPDPKLLEEYEALREAYDHYKTLEGLLHKPKT